MLIVLLKTSKIFYDIFYKNLLKTAMCTKHISEFINILNYE